MKMPLFFYSVICFKSEDGNLKHLQNPVNFYLVIPYCILCQFAYFRFVFYGVTVSATGMIYRIFCFFTTLQNLSCRFCITCKGQDYCAVLLYTQKNFSPT